MSNLHKIISLVARSASFLESEMIGAVEAFSFHLERYVRPSLNFVPGFPNCLLPSLSHPLDDAILYAVPKKRRSAEVRQRRKLGFNPYYGSKLYQPRTDLLLCHKCGSHYEAGRLCPHCYTKVMKETVELQEKIMSEIMYKPITKEIAIVYNGESKEDLSLREKVLVEIDKKRPSWFSKDLKERTVSSSKDEQAITPPKFG